MTCGTLSTSHQPHDSALFPIEKIQIDLLLYCAVEHSGHWSSKQTKYRPWCLHKSKWYFPSTRKFSFPVALPLPLLIDLISSRFQPCGPPQPEFAVSGLNVLRTIFANNYIYLRCSAQLTSPHENHLPPSRITTNRRSSIQQSLLSKKGRKEAASWLIGWLTGFVIFRHVKAWQRDSPPF